MRSTELESKLSSLPTRPGCYLFKDGGGQVIYVGKAISLRNRVRSYFQKSAALTLKTRRLVEAVRDLETIVVDSELEALVLECSLIKKHQPHYNVRLRDDKQYPYLCVTTSEPFPRLLLTRRVRHDGNKYFGPYSGSRAVYATMDLMKRLFPIVSCGKPFDGRPVQKPCLYYHMGQCLAPCAGLAEGDDYKRAVADVVAFLEGRPEKVVRDLRAQMEQAAEELQFERAIKLRDQVNAVEEVMARQKVMSSQAIDQDVVAVVGVGAPGDSSGAAVQMFYIRGGKLVGQNAFMLEGSEEETQAEAVQEFVKQFYSNAPYVPQEILLPCDIDEVTIIQSWLKQKRGSKVEITVPVRGDKRRLMEMASENAVHALETMKAEMRAKLGNAERALDDLADALGLEAPPRRIECYDISNFQGEHFVGSMVVFTDGVADKVEYRRFKIKYHENKPDDFAMMREIITRRLQEAVGTPDRAPNPKFARLPDLLIVDGGKGQLASAISATEGTGFRVQGVGVQAFRASGAQASDTQLSTRNPQPAAIPLAALAKRFEHLYLPGEPDPVILPRSSQALYLVQRIRDEAHRFANAYRVTLQAKKQVRSALDTVPGIGPTRRKALLKHFGSLEKLRCASLDDIAAAPKMTRPAAESVFAYLQQSS